MQVAEMNRDEEIRQAAYKLWQEEGCPDGYDVQHWLKAEAIWLEENSPRNRPNLSVLGLTSSSKAKMVLSSATLGSERAPIRIVSLRKDGSCIWPRSQ